MRKLFGFVAANARRARIASAMMIRMVVIKAVLQNDMARRRS